MLDCKLSQDTFQAIISVIIYFACFVCLFIAGVPMRIEGMMLQVVLSRNSYLFRKIR